LDLLGAFLGEADAVGRDHLVEQAGGPLTLAIRKGQWKLIPRLPGAARAASARPELYDLAADPAEAKNVIDAHPEVVEELSALLQRIREAGHTPR
jgi:hypothetical protein